MGEGEVDDADGVRRPAAQALAAAGLAPVTLAAKEGLALINGTDGMLGMLVLALADLRMLLRTADVAAAMTVEALLGTDRVFAADLMALRPHPGQGDSAANLRVLLASSGVVASHRTPDCTRVQDAYSLRCAPQVHGAARDTLAHAETVAARELASAIDNPVVTPDGRVESNGNFHGAPVGYVLDFLAIAVADVASMSERRTDRFLDVARNHGLPPFLADDPGVDSGLMIAQYTAAGLVAQLKRLAVPASVDSIPSSAMQEDHVSMGWHAARKLRQAVDALAAVLAIEVMTASRALDLRCAPPPPLARDHARSRQPAAALEPAPGTGAVARLLRETGIDGPGPDRHLAPEIARATELVRSGAVVAVVESMIGRLQ
jgi:histidine ammonia-lyase